MKKVQLVVVAILFATQIFAQTGVVISETPNDTPDESAILEVKSTTQGFLPPRMTSGQRDIITNPALGLVIFNTSRNCLEFCVGNNKWTSSDPSGTIKSFAGSVLPEGWLWCDGSSVSRATYYDLWQSIGVNWGQGNNTTTFNLPDLRGNFLRGVDNMNNTVGTGGGIANNDPNSATRTAKYTGGNTGNEVGSFQGDEFKEHQHSVSDPGHSHNYLKATHQQNLFVSSGGANGYSIGTWPSVSTTNSATNISINVSGGSETRPTNAYVNYIIKY